MKRLPPTQYKYNSSLHDNDRGASTFQLIALVAVVLMLITAAYTTIKNRSGEIDAANNAWMDNQVQLWRENGNPGPPYQGMTYQWDVSGGQSDNLGPPNQPPPGPIIEVPASFPPPPLEECDSGFFAGVWQGIKDLFFGIIDLIKLVKDLIVNTEEGVEQLEAIVEQLEQLKDGIWSILKNLFWDRDFDAAAEETKELLKTLFPAVAEALDGGCYGEAAGLITVEILSSVVSVTKVTKLIKVIKKLNPQQLLAYLKTLKPSDLMRIIDELSAEDRKKMKEDLEQVGAPCSILNAFGNSFSADTLVMTPHGPVAISTIEIGDLVLAYHEITGEVDSYPVTATMAHLDPEIVLLTIENELIETTPEHPFYVMEGAPWLAHGQTAGRWVVAEALERGDDIRKLDGSTGDITSTEIVLVEQWMYNLTVAEAHTFFVGQGEWLVHNCNAYEVAKSGGKHSGFYKNYLNATNQQLLKGIKSLQKEIAEHYDKIANPRKHIPNWDDLDPRQQKHLVEVKWLQDIARQQEQMDILQGILNER